MYILVASESKVEYSTKCLILMSYTSVWLVSLVPDGLEPWLWSGETWAWFCNLLLITRKTIRLTIPPTFENMVTAWIRAGGRVTGSTNTQIPNKASVSHWKMNAKTNNDMARTAECFILEPDDCFPSERLNFFSMDRSFAHVITYNVVFTIRIKENGRVTRKNWANPPFTPSKKQLKDSNKPLYRATMPLFFFLGTSTADECREK